MYIDVHCHLDYYEDVKKIVSSADKKGVKTIVSNGTNVEKNRKVLEISKEFSNVKAALGIYPLEALKMSDQEIKDELKFIEKNKEKIVAIGEVGIDFKELVEKEKQEKVFSDFVKLSIKLDKPIIVHSRKAEQECIEILEKLKAKKVVMHCFSGKKGLMKRIVENGWTFSIPASVKNSEHFQYVIDLCPIEQLLGETDSPYLHPDKEFPNEPANVIESYKKIAEIKKVELKNVEKQIEINFIALFGKL